MAKNGRKWLKMLDNGQKWLEKSESWKWPKIIDFFGWIFNYWGGGVNLAANGWTCLKMVGNIIRGVPNRVGDTSSNHRKVNKLWKCI